MDEEANEDLPYAVEYAKSGRAGCKICKNKIGKDELRLATVTQSPFHDGKIQKWFHPHCFFTKQRPKQIGDIAGFDKVRYEDQQLIKNKLAEQGSAPGPQGKSRKRGKSAVNKDFTAQYAKSNRSKCIGCEETIVKDEVRIGKKDYESEEAIRLGGIDRWYHLECFVKLRQELQFLGSADSMFGFEALSKEDMAMLKNKIPKIDGGNASAPKKPKLEKEDVEKEKTMEKQNKKIYSFKDKLANFMRAELIELLHKNKQQVPEGRSNIVDLLSDIMTFGALEPCPLCNGQLIYKSGLGYKCTGNLDEWTKCVNVVSEPKRRQFSAPSALKEKYDFLETTKFKIEARAFKLTASSVSSAVKKEDTVDGPKVAPSQPRPLKNMEFFFVGRLEKDRDELKRQILLNGGQVASKLHENVVAVISTPAEVKKMSRKILEAQELNVQVISEDFIDEVKDFIDAPVMLINKKNICEWGADPSTRIAKCAAKSAAKSSKSRYNKSSSEKVKLRVKGGGAVDPDSGLEDVAHIYQSNDLKYTVTLGKTDIQAKKNSYYKLQILKHDKQDKFWLFRNWGRIGTTIGGHTLNDFSTLGEAIDKFEEMYLDKTGNEWGQRFVKKPGFMYLLDVDEAPEESSIDLLHSNIKSKLAQPVQELIQLIFDEKLMKKTMMEFEIDTEKMPLGKLSKKQIHQAYQVLTDLSVLIKSGTAQRIQLVGKTNQFYTLVPHSFGMADPTIIDSEELIQTKTQMLESLLEIEVAYNLLHAKTDESMNPLDAHYEQLKADVEVLERDSEEFKMVQMYTKNTHAATHNLYELEIEHVYKVKRNGEDKRYKPFRKLANKKLLWHGSRTSNFAGILSQGLRIAPPEAPVTGYMFGKGLYFADMVSKSANYCCTSSQSTTGLLLLCEVALGNVYDRYRSDYIEKLPAGKHSTFAHGKTQPNPAESKTIEGVEVPLGSGVAVDMKERSDLLYNEYIVYDVAQAKIEYLVRMKFNYKC